MAVRTLTERVTGVVLPGADVQAGEQDGVVVAPPPPAPQARLPLAEAVQGVVGVVVDHQTVLEKRLGE
jgi:hypothetical protein